MALYRKVLTNLWGEVWFENAGVSSKLLYLYALTCDRTTPAGMYQISRQRLMFETQLTHEQLSEALTQLEGMEKLYFDEAAGVLWVPDFRIYNDSTSPAWLTGVHNAVLATPDCSVKERYLEIYPLAQVALPDRRPMVTRRSGDSRVMVTRPSADPQVTVTRPSPQQEQEQEQEKEQEHQHQHAGARRLTDLTDPDSGFSDADLGLTELSERDRDLVWQAIDLREKAARDVLPDQEILQMGAWAVQYGACALHEATKTTVKTKRRNVGGYLRTVLQNNHTPSGPDPPKT